MAPQMGISPEALAEMQAVQEQRRQMEMARGNLLAVGQPPPSTDEVEDLVGRYRNELARNGKLRRNIAELLNDRTEELLRHSSRLEELIHELNQLQVLPSPRPEEAMPSGPPRHY